MKIALRIRFRVGAIRVGEGLFNAILDDEDKVELMTNALTGEVCDISAIYQGFLVLRDDRLNDEDEDISAEIIMLGDEYE